jgi:predicted AlkP superfamily phosphohydrolase/phosphomutase
MSKNSYLQCSLWGLVAGGVAGTVFGLEMCGAGDLLAYPIDALTLTLIFMMIGAVGTFILFSLFYPVAALFSHPPNFVIKIASVLTVLFPQLFLFWVEYNRPVNITNIKFIFGALLLFLICLLAAVFMIRFLGKRTWFPGGVKLRHWLYGIGSFLGGLAILILVFSLTVGHTSIRTEPLPAIKPTGKVLLIGVDAADMRTLLPLVQAKKLPVFEKLLSEGASGPLPSLVSGFNPLSNTITNGIKSAAVWNSILTGKSPGKHGIKDFIYTEMSWLSHPFRYPLLPSFMPYRKQFSHMLGLHYRPYNRLLRKTKAVWNIFSDAGLEVGTLGWWMTWPVEEINGDNLTDRFDDPTLPLRWFPENLVSQTGIDTLSALYQNPKSQDVKFFTLFSYEPDFVHKFNPDSREYFRHFMIQNLLKSYYQDSFRLQLGLDLLKKYDYTFFGLYLYGLDTAGHGFSRFKFPHLFADVQAEEVEYFGQIIDRYYEWVDQAIGKILQNVDDQTTVVICSDHGMGPFQGLTLKKHDLPLSGRHGKDGIIILWGAKIRKGIQIKPHNLLDVLPTILYLTGLPIADDMDGRLLTDAIDPDELQLHPPGTIATYETGRYVYHPEQSASSLNYDKNMLQRLKTLGYLK